MKESGKTYAAWDRLAAGVVAVLVASAILAIFLVAPTEETMGHAQRIVYVHVAVAWFALLAFGITAATGLLYLVRRDLSWDHWSQAAAEVGWLCGGLTLVTGSLWAHSAWGVWWTWDPRLATSFILWAIYSGYLITRGAVDDPHRRARLAAVLAIAGALDIPLVIMATRWFRGVHPVSPAMETSMRLVLLLAIAAFTAFFLLLVARRRAQLHLQSLLEAVSQQADLERRQNPDCAPPGGRVARRPTATQHQGRRTVGR